MNIKFDRDRVGLRYRPTDEHVRAVAARAVDSRGGDVTAARAHLRELVALESAAVANDVRYIADRAQLARDNPALLVGLPIRGRPPVLDAGRERRRDSRAAAPARRPRGAGARVSGTKKLSKKG